MLREMAVSRVNYKVSLRYLVLAKSKEMLKLRMGTCQKDMEASLKELPLAKYEIV